MSILSPGSTTSSSSMTRAAGVMSPKSSDVDDVRRHAGRCEAGLAAGAGGGGADVGPRAEDGPGANGRPSRAGAGHATGVRMRGDGGGAPVAGLDAGPPGRGGSSPGGSFGGAIVSKLHDGSVGS